MEYTLENYRNSSSDLVFDLTCVTCGKTFTKTKREIQRNKNIIPKCCSKECRKKLKDLGEVEVICKNCGKSKIIKVSEYNKSKTKLFFCNNSCSAEYNNKLRVKHSESNICPICKKPKTKSGKICKDCENQKRKDLFLERKLGEFIGFDKKEKFLTTKCTKIRKHARQILIDNKISCECAICHNPEFNQITEVHHKKLITDFSPETKISEINDVSNLVWLCPNHHRLVHLGIIKL